MMSAEQNGNWSMMWYSVFQRNNNYNFPFILDTFFATDLFSGWWRWVAVLMIQDIILSRGTSTHRTLVLRSWSWFSPWPREPAHLDLQLVLVLLTSMWLIMHSGGSTDPGWLQRRSLSSWCTSGSEEEHSVISICYLVSLYHSREILFLALVARCLFWVYLLTISTRCLFIMSTVDSNWQSFFRICMCFSVAD